MSAQPLLRSIIYASEATHAMTASDLETLLINARSLNLKNGITGVLLPPADPSDTASAVARFLSDDVQRAAMGNAGRTRVMRDFGEAAMIEGFAAAASAAANRSA